MRTPFVGRARPTAVCLAVAAVLLAGCGSSGTDLADQEPTDQVEVMSWWTSESERPALQSLFDAYSAEHPDVKVVDAAVAGGGGSNVQVALATRLQADDPPDVWQTFIGSSTQDLAGRGPIADISAAYPDDLVDALPEAVLDAVTVDGRRYSMPTGTHRSNVLWYSTAALEKAGVTPPGDDYTMTAFLADLATVKDAGEVPLCLGGKDAFTSAELFESVLLAEVGAQGWADITRDRFDWNGTAARAALRTFDRVLDDADPASDGLTWDDAMAKLAGGKCAFVAFNDSGYAELVANGAKEGADFGGVAFPGTQDSYLAVVDAFVVAADPANARNALDFVTTVAGKEETLGFNRLKGSVPVRTDVDVSSLSDYQQQAAKDYREQRFLLSVAHGEALSQGFQGGFYDAVATYRDSRSATAFARTLADAVAEEQGINVNN